MIVLWQPQSDCITITPKQCNKKLKIWYINDIQTTLRSDVQHQNVIMITQKWFFFIIVTPKQYNKKLKIWYMNMAKMLEKTQTTWLCLTSINSLHQTVAICVMCNASCFHNFHYSYGCRLLFPVETLNLSQKVPMAKHLLVIFQYVMCPLQSNMQRCFPEVLYQDMWFSINMSYWTFSLFSVNLVQTTQEIKENAF